MRKQYDAAVAAEALYRALIEKLDEIDSEGEAELLKRLEDIDDDIERETILGGLRAYITRVARINEGEDHDE